LESDDSGKLTSSDGNTAHNVVVSIISGVPSAIAANLTGLKDSPITATLHLNNDPAGNSFTDVITNATLDEDTGEQAVTDTLVGSGIAGAVHFSVGGLEADDSGTVTFSDGTNHVTVDVSGALTNYTADLTALKDGRITSTLSINPDPAGNLFTPVFGNPVTLDQRGDGNNETLRAGDEAHQILKLVMAIMTC
jgi:large repetitive protein